MNPKLVLSLWRERWGKTADIANALSYLKGKPNAWGEQLVHNGMWSLPAATAVATAVCISLVVWMLTIPLSMGGQVAFSIVLAGFAVYIRRYRGALITLALLGLSVLVSARYLWWRFAATLGQEFNSDFVLGFGLWVAEFHVVLLATIGLAQKVWPLKRPTIDLPHDHSKWPTVDIYVLSHGQSRESIMERCSLALTSNWPKKKLQVFLLDSETRPDIERATAAMGVTYLGRTDQCADATRQVSWALQRTKGELVAVFDGEQVADKNFLKMAVGWFVRDHTLGLLRTPQHFLGHEAVPKNLTLFQTTASVFPCALVRRSMMLVQVGDENGPSPLDDLTVRKGQMVGFNSGYIGFNDDPVEGSGAGIFRVDHRMASARIIWQQRLKDLQTILQFYLPFSRLIFFTAPVAGLLLDVQLIHTSFDFLAAYAVPHFVHSYIVKGRMHGSKRLALWADARDTILACYMLIPTLLSVVRTEIGRLSTKHNSSQQSTRERFEWSQTIPYCTILILNLSGLVAGASQLLLSANQLSTDFKFYALWCVCNIMLLAATLAIAEESRQIRSQTRRLSCIPAMLRLPSRHTLNCETRNFPNTTLALSLPIRLTLEPGVDVGISIFFNQREFEFSARVVSVGNGLLSVRITEAQWSRYQTTGSAILSRGQDWPQWLPGKNADQPIPHWITRPVGAAILKVKTLVERIVRVIKRSPIGLWAAKREIQS